MSRPLLRVPVFLTDVEREQITLGDPILATLRRLDLPITRRSYIAMNWGEMPEDWGAEHEAMLPEELQDWSWIGREDAGDDEV